MKWPKKVPGLTCSEKITYHLSSGLKVREYYLGTYITRENWREVWRDRHDYATATAHQEMGEWLNTRLEKAEQHNQEFSGDTEKDSTPFMPVFADVGRKTAWRIPLHSITAISVRTVFRVTLRPTKRSMDKRKNEWMDQGLKTILDTQDEGE